ncbi:MAG: hypothetical protein M3135_05010 [Actinomycetota bacterium]|nr:hypothetical protein [Actinomycetota bacterium]
MLSAADMEAALGEPFHDGTNAPQMQPNICTFTSKEGVGKNVSMVIYSPGGAAMLPMMMPQPTDVPGIGDKAAWYGMGRIFGVLKGDSLLTLQFVGYPDENQCFEAAKQLAQKAAPQL